jgi:hypothetical protein
MDHDAMLPSAELDTAAHEQTDHDGLYLLVHEPAMLTRHVGADRFSLVRVPTGVYAADRIESPGLSAPGLSPSARSAMRARSPWIVIRDGGCGLAECTIGAEGEGLKCSLEEI